MLLNNVVERCSRQDTSQSATTVLFWDLCVEEIEGVCAGFRVEEFCYFVRILRKFYVKPILLFVVDYILAHFILL